jgi:low temperature requirement protein LtrA
VSVDAQAAFTKVAQERRSTPVELLWDLVFVFAVIQVMALVAHHPTWSGFGEAMLVLVWWAWPCWWRARRF